MVALGKGFFIQQIEKTAPKIDSLTDMILDMGLQQIVLKVLDQTNVMPIPSVLSDERLIEWDKYLNEQGITLWGWADIGAVDFSAAIDALVNRIIALNLSYVVLRPCGYWQANQARQFTTLLANTLPQNITLAIANSPYEQDFPLAQFATISQVIMPLVPLNTQAGNVTGNLQNIQQTYTQYFPDKKLMPVAITTGQMYAARPYYWYARPDQIIEFLNACASLNIEAVNFFTWQDVRYKQPLWQSIQSWQYQPLQVQQAVTTSTPTETVSAQSVPTTATTTSNLSPTEQLYQYGIALGSDKGGKWNDDEIGRVLDVVNNIAEAISPLFQAIYNLNDPIAAFQLLYAPMVVKRNPTNNVNPSGTAVWYGRNASGLVMYYSNKMFISGRESLRTGDGLGFNSEQIIAHEFAHTINFRYPKIASLTGGDLDQFYGNQLQTGSYTLASGETVRLNNVNSGYSFAARSNREFYETVTDAIANYTFDGLTIGDNYSSTENLEGQARLEQLSSMLTHVIRHRVKNYGQLDDIVAKMRKLFDDNTVKEAQPAIDALRSLNLDGQLAALRG